MLYRLLIVLFGLILASPLSADISIDPTVPTERDFIRARVEIALAKLPQSWTPQQRESIWFERWMSLRPDVVKLLFDRPPDWEKLEGRRRLVALRAAGCDDPLIDYFLAFWNDTPANDRPDLRHRSAALKSFDEWGYSAMWTVRACRAHLTALTDSSEEKSLVRIHRALLEAFRTHCFTSHPWGDQAFFAECRPAFDHDYPFPPIEQLVTDVTAEQNCSEWLRLMLQGRLEEHRAWRIRDGLFEDDDPARRNLTFDRSLALARSHYTAAYELRPDRPEAAGRMVAVAVATEPQSRQEIREWFDRALAAQSDHPPALAAMVNSLREYWNGSTAQLLDFAEECADTVGAETRIPEYGLSAIRRAIRFLDDDERQPYQTRAVELAQRLGEGLLATPRGQRKIDLFGTWVIVIAIRCERWDVASEWYERVNDLHIHPLKRMGLEGGDVRDELILRRTGIHGIVADSWVALEIEGPQAAIDSMNSLLETVEDPAARALLRERLYIATILQDFATGEPVPLLVDDQLSGWRPQGGQWVPTHAGNMMAATDEAGCRIHCIIPFGQRYRFTGTIRDKSFYYFRAGAMFASGMIGRRETNWEAVTGSHDGTTLSWIGQGGVPGKSRLAKRSKRRTFEVLAWDGRYHILFNGEVATETPFVPEYSVGDWIGLYVAWRNPGPTGIFSDLTIQRLDSCPPELQELP